MKRFLFVFFASISVIRCADLTDEERNNHLLVVNKATLPDHIVIAGKKYDCPVQNILSMLSPAITLQKDFFGEGFWIPLDDDKKWKNVYQILQARYLKNATKINGRGYVNFLKSFGIQRLYCISSDIDKLGVESVMNDCIEILQSKEIVDEVLNKHCRLNTKLEDIVGSNLIIHGQIAAEIMRRIDLKLFRSILPHLEFNSIVMREAEDVMLESLTDDSLLAIGDQGTFVQYPYCVRENDFTFNEKIPVCFFTPEIYALSVQRVSPNKCVIVSGSCDTREIKIFSYEDTAVSHNQEGIFFRTEADPDQVTVIPEEYVVYASDKKLYCYDLKTKETEELILHEPIGTLLGLVYVGHALLYAGCKEGSFRIFRLTPNKTPRGLLKNSEMLIFEPLDRSGVTCIAHMKNGESDRVACLYESGTLICYDCGTSKRVLTQEVGASAQKLAIHPTDPNLFVTLHKPIIMRLWKKCSEGEKFENIVTYEKPSPPVIGDSIRSGCWLGNNGICLSFKQNNRIEKCDVTKIMSLLKWMRDNKNNLPAAFGMYIAQEFLAKNKPYDATFIKKESAQALLDLLPKEFKQIK